MQTGANCNLVFVLNSHSLNCSKSWNYGERNFKFYTVKRSSRVKVRKLSEALTVLQLKLVANYVKTKNAFQPYFRADITQWPLQTIGRKLLRVEKVQTKLQMSNNTLVQRIFLIAVH